MSDYKFKVIVAERNSELEQKVNEWLDSVFGIEVVNMQYYTSSADYCSVAILYKILEHDL